MITVQRAFPVRDLWSGLTLSIRNLPTFDAAAGLLALHLLLERPLISADREIQAE